MASKKIELKCSKLLLTEGADAYFFLIWACVNFGIEDVQVLDYGGINELTKYLGQLKLAPCFDDLVKTIVVIRDAERNAGGAVSSIKTSLRATGLPAPNKPFEFCEKVDLRTAFAIFPGNVDESGAFTDGTLEDLCLAMIGNEPLLECVSAFLECAATINEPLTHSHKSIIHAYFSAKNKFVGMKIGEAAKSGALNWDHKLFEPFKQLIQSM